jgi:hypothetical protein
MRKRDIFSLLVACHEVTYDKDGKRHVYIDEEKSVKNLNDLKKAINTLPKDVQEEFRLTQARVRMFKQSYHVKYSHLRVKAHSIYDPAQFKIRRKDKPIEVVTTGNKEASEEKQGE